jgi:PKD repeat protein
MVRRIIVAAIVGLALAASASGAVYVDIQPTGLDPTIAFVQDDAVDWTNWSSQTQSIVSADGLFDSGPIPPEGGYSLHLPRPGDYRYTAWPNSFVGTLSIARALIGGNTRDSVSVHIPDLPFPEDPAADHGIDPDFGVGASKSRIIVLFKDEATVGEANAALTKAGVEIIGGLPLFGVLLVQSQPPESGLSDADAFVRRNAALASLRADGSVSAAALDLAVEQAAVPQPTSFDYTIHYAGGNVVTKPSNWIWDAHPAGDNWYLEADRAPQAWNLRQAAAAKPWAKVSPVLSLVVDDLVDTSQQDVRDVTLEEFCTTDTPQRCTSTTVGSHGTHVAGTIGGSYDDGGIDGVDPVAKLHSIGSRLLGSSTAPGTMFDKTLADQLQLFSLILQQVTPGGRLFGLRVLNYSLRLVPPSVTALRKLHLNYKSEVVSDCGSGPADDGLPGSNQSCSPNNDDSWLAHARAAGEVAGHIAEIAADRNVIIVQSAGNESDDYCDPLWDEPPACTNGHLVQINAETMASFVWAEKHWVSALPNPVVGVEALDESLAAAKFSNVSDGHDISAPGVDIVNASVGGGFELMDGTSMAAPQVTGAIAYLLAYDPTLTIEQVKAALYDWANDDTTSITFGISKRLDVFASLMSLPGARADLVDVNDRSKDGDLGFTIQPDHKVDMRDFRAFRDAWLVSCNLQTDAIDLEFCPAADNVKLEGLYRKDLNLDGCVSWEDGPACPSSEAFLSRFDFNGDGKVDKVDTADLPPDAAGGPSGPPAETLTDLQVLQSQWPADDQQTEGWKKSDLDNLLESGDLEIHADDLFNQGATDVKVELTSSDSGSLPERHIKPELKPEKSFIVATVPTDPSHLTKIKVEASATVAGETIKTTPAEVELKIGEDKRIDLCQGLTVTATPSELTDDGKETSKLVAQMHKCSHEEVANRPISFTLDHTSGGVSLGAADATTDANGRAAATFTTGTATDTYKVKATVTLDGTNTDTAEATIKVRPPIKIAYVWKQHVEGWSEAGSTHWPDPLPAKPDCTVPGVVEYCIDSYQVQLTSETNGGIERSGTLDGGGSDFKLTEQVKNSLGRSHRQWHLTKQDGHVETFSGDASWQVLDPTAYQDKALTNVRATFRDDGIHVAGMQNVGDLPYHYDLSAQHPPGGQLEPPELLGIANRAFMLIPHVSEGPIRFAGSPGAEIAFPFDASSQTYQPYKSCGELDVAGDTSPGYFVQRTDPYVPFVIGRVDTYEAGARPMPVGPLTLKATYAFGAVVTVGDAPAGTPALPDCTTSHPPVPKFDGPAETPEGRQTHFLDRSTDVENDIESWSWDFGDGEEGSSAQDPYHMFPDNGTYIVTLTVTDQKGLSASTTKAISVTNQAPLAYIDDATAEKGQPLTFNYGIWDAGKIDRDQLLWSLESTNGDWQVQSNMQQAFDSSATVLNLPAGLYPMTLTVIDKDGESSTAEATFEVTEGPPPVCDPATGENCPPIPPTPPYVVCGSGAVLDAEEQAFLDLINQYRIQNGLSPLGVSPTLQTAADEHAHDMAVNDFMSHTGSDGSQPEDRAWNAGYPKTAGVGENIASDAETGFQAMWAWKSSPPHNANMLNPSWTAIGIAREKGNHWRWSTSFGTVLDCQTGPTVFSVSKAALRSTATASTPTTPVKARIPPGGVRVVHRRWVVHPVVRLVRRQHHRVRRSRHAPARRFADTTADQGFGPGAAFTISKVTATATKPVKLTNRSRDAEGRPVAATVDFGDGTAPVSLAADASTTHSFPTPWALYDVVLTAVDAAGRSTTVDRQVFVLPLPQPALFYTGTTTQGIANKQLAVAATLHDVVSGDPLAGEILTFKLADRTAVATTDSSGAAHTTLDLTGIDVGFRDLTVSFAGNADYGAFDQNASIYLLKTKPELTYTGSVNGATGKPLAVAAKLIDPDSKEPIAGADLSFMLLTGAYPTVTATSDASGTATATIDLTGVSPGTYAVLATFAGNDDYERVQNVVNVSITRNTAPVANAGGPYVLGVGGTLLLDGGLSTDPDAGDRVAAWAWDLNGDGAIDLTGATPRALSWSELQTLLCRTACAANVDYTIKLTATDTRGDASSATTTVRFASDFGLLLGAGTTTTVVPGQSNSFAVTVVGSSDFHSPVTLAAVGLPSGVTAHFSVNPVTPPGISVLTLTVASSAPTGTFPIRVTGTANGITHEVSDNVNVAFGLVPVCYGTVAGTVADETGAPIAGASVSNFASVSDTTDANGRFTLRNLPLGANNAPSNTPVIAWKTGYWQAVTSAPVYCGAATQVALTMLRARTGHVSGVVHEGTADASGLVVTPTATVVPNASVLFDFGPTFHADTNGAYAADLDLNQNNSPRSYSAKASAPGYWYQTKAVLAEASVPKQLDFALVKQCHGTLVGGTLRYEDGSPAADHYVFIDELGNGDTVAVTKTDAQGGFTFERDELLGYNNVPRDYTLLAYPSPADPQGTQKQTFAWPLGGCGDRSSRIFTLQLPPGSHGAIEGTVRDEETGAPIAGATVSGYTSPALPGNTSPTTTTTDENGRYHVDNVLIGYGTSTDFRLVAATKDGYYSTWVPATLSAGATTTVDLTLLRRRTGAATGHVRDAVTGAPIAGASVEGGFRCSLVCTTTAGDGTYSATSIALGLRNEPVSGTVTASADQYWPQSKLVQVSADATTKTDFDLLRKCTPAKIIGLVVDASTQQPIEHAQVAASTRSAFTDAVGRFELSDVQPGPANIPLQVTLTASAPGFISQSKTVTIFCGATVVVDFGTRQSAFGIVVGKIVDAGTDLPLPNVFVGSEFGGAATTDASGNYRIANVPLGDQDADRSWTLTATPAGYAPITLTVVAKANVEVRADFSFSKRENRRPVATDDTLATSPGIAVPVLLGASDPDGDVLVYSILAGPAHGLLSGIAPALTYTPDPGYVGSDSFTFKASDGKLDSNVAAVSVTIAETNRAPLAVDDEFSTHFGTNVGGELVANDSDLDGTPLTVDAATLSAPAHGLLLASATGFVYTPEPDFVGDDSFTYRATDGALLSNAATVTIHVTDTAPSAGDDRFTTIEGRALHVADPGVLANDGDPDGDPLSASVAGGPEHGLLALAPAGGFDYTPDPGFHGTDTFTYSAEDGGLASAPATVRITVDAPPHAADDEVSTHANVPLTFDPARNDDDPDGDAIQLVVSSLSAPAHGTVTSDGTTVTYTPEPGFVGDDSITYETTDGVAESAPATVTIHVTNAVPVARSATLALDEDTEAAVPFAASDGDADPTTFAVVSGPEHGTIAHGVYTPAADYFGADAIVFTANDGFVDSLPATIEITVRPVNDPPRPADDAAVTAEDTPATLDVLANDSAGPANEAAQKLTLDSVAAPMHGSATISGNEIRYEPEANFSGADAFVYRVCDDGEGEPRCAVGTLRVDVTPVNDPPTANDTVVTLNEDDPPVTIDLRPLAHDLETPASSLGFAIATGPVKGVLYGSGGVVTYRPNPHVFGTDSFRYELTDGGDPDGCSPAGTHCDSPRSARGTVTITIVHVNHAPTLTLAPAFANEGSAVPLDAIATDPDGDSLTYSWRSDLGTVAPVADGSQALFTADDGPATAHVTVTASDGSLTTTATAEVTVRNVAPTAAASAAPSPQYWGLPVHFVGSASDPSRTDTAAGLNPFWSFGDGGTSSAAELSHAYARPGPYTATFAVRDKDGDADSMSKQIDVTRRVSSLTYTGAATVGEDPNARVVLSALFSDLVDRATGDVAGHPVAFTIGGNTFTASTDASGVATVSASVEPGTVTVAFAGDALYLAAQTQARIDYPVVFGDGGGFFTVGPNAAAIGRTVTFWSSSWAAANLVAAPPSFKGFVASPVTPACGSAWTSRPGNSGDPPPAVPHYLAVVVTSSATQSQSVLGGDVAHVAIIRTAAGYGPSPGRDGSGEVVSIVC